MVHQIQVNKDQIKSLVKRLVLAALVYLLPVLVCCPVTNAQEKPETAAVATKAEDAQKHTKQEEEKFTEFDFVGSNDYRSVSMVVPIFRGLNVEGHYFGIRVEPEFEEHLEHRAERRFGILDAGIINGSYSFRLGEHIVLSPGFGVFFGEGQKTSPAFTFRWEIEKGRLFSQGLFIQALQGSEEFGRVSIWDGNHVSLRVSRFEFGPSWERIHTREENEWKGGGRVAFRILRNLSVFFLVYAPMTEYRGGIIIHPER